jgi:hypothetical protein
LEKSLEEVHRYSIPADAVQKDRSVLLSSYESTSLAHARAERPSTACEDVQRHSNEQPAEGYDRCVKRGCGMKQAVTPHVIAENRGHPGLTAGFWGCILAVLGITSLGVLSVPIAFVCTLVGLVRGIVARDATSIGTSLLAACLCVVGFASSPLLLAITALLATNTPSQGTPAPHSLQQGQQTEATSQPGMLHR